jgi:hypothetical protein
LLGADGLSLGGTLCVHLHLVLLAGSLLCSTLISHHPLHGGLLLGCLLTGCLLGTGLSRGLITLGLLCLVLSRPPASTHG